MGRIMVGFVSFHVSQLNQRRGLTRRARGGVLEGHMQPECSRQNDVARWVRRSPARVLVVLCVVALGARALAQPTEDHLACYKVKDPGARRKFTVRVANAAGAVTCRVKAPAKLGCLGSSTSGIAPNPPAGAVTSGTAGNLLCYSMKCAKPFPAATDLTDELVGRRVVRFRAATLLCAPASGSPVSGPTTTTLRGPTTTTLPEQACHFDDDERRCEGSCAPGRRCATVASGGDCECRATPCGDADTPECNGYCQPDEACIFAITGCRCVGIP